MTPLLCDPAPCPARRGVAAGPAQVRPMEAGVMDDMFLSQEKEAIRKIVLD